MLTFTINTNKLKKLISQLSKRRFDDLKVKIGDYLVSSTQNKINKDTFIDNAPVTQAIKQNNKPLRDRGTLMSSIAKRIEDDKIKIGTTHIAGKILNQGGTITGNLFIPAGYAIRKLQRKYGGFKVRDVING